MAEKAFPSTGDVIPADKLFVSKCNVNFGKPFGESEKDQKLIHQITETKKIVQPFKARPETNEDNIEGFGVFVGRRRFLGAEKSGVFKGYRVGVDILLEDVDDTEARRESLIENLDPILRATMDPITRAEQVNELISSNPSGLRSTARKVGVAASTLSEWRQVLKLSSPMQQQLREGKIIFSDALNLVRMELAEDLQGNLAEILEKEGIDAYEKELERHQEGKKKRGIKTGQFAVIRLLYNKTDPLHMTIFSALEKRAKAKDQELMEYAMTVLEQHVKIAS